MKTKAMPSMLLQNPAAVQNSVMSVYNDGPFGVAPSRAHDEHVEFRALIKQAGIRTHDVKETLSRSDPERLHALARSSVGSPGKRNVDVERNLTQMSAVELAEVITQQPRLDLVPAPELAKISPDGWYERYITQPLAGLMFPRDHFVALPGSLLLSNFRRPDRRRESAVMRLVLETLMPSMTFHDAPEHLEGGDVLRVPGTRLLVVSAGCRTTFDAVEALSALAGDQGWSTVVVQDRVRHPDQFHLDHWGNVTGNRLHLLEERARHNEICRWREGSPRAPWREESLAAILSKAGGELCIVPALPPGEGLNYVYLPTADRVILPSDHPGLAEWVIDKVTSSVTTETRCIATNFGGPHCATNELIG